jgi:hypothetical protein
MSHTLTVPTSFEDISELTTGLTDRVDEGRLMLYGPEPVPDGQPIRFSVLLLDQTPALEGTGRAVTSIDGGEERAPEVRFDIVLEALELEGMGEVVFERILLARQSVASGDTTGQIRVEDAEAAAVAEAVGYDEVAPSAAAVHAEPAGGHGGNGGWTGEPAYSASESYPDDGGSAGEAEGADDWRSRAGERGGARAEAGGSAAAHREAEIIPLDDDVPPSDTPAGPRADHPSDAYAASPPGILTRPSRRATWVPEYSSVPAPRPSSGMFVYKGALPIPGVPPRPELDPSMWVKPAPRPDGATEAAGGSRGAWGDASADTHPHEAGPEPDFGDTEMLESPDSDRAHTLEEDER